jgi:superfamily II DNA or RNA helicase
MKTGQKPPRDWQTQAQRKILEAWMRDAKYRALIAACPGSGKTRCAVEISDELRRSGRIEVTLVIAPTINIQRQWVKEFAAFGIEATCNANNEALRWRRDEGSKRSMREDKAVIVITFAQLARDPDLFAEFIRRHPALVIVDEVHHADDDETFGEAINHIADCDNMVHSLALSGTPFNTGGGSLALCETDPEIDPDTGALVRVTKPTYSYSYGDAINADVCRKVDFVKVEGSGRATYRSLIDRQLFERLINLSRASDPIGLMLDPDGEYMGQCIREALAALARMREAGDRRAAMLVVGKDVSHGNRLIAAIERIKQERPEWEQFANIQEIYNDSEKAHNRIEALNKDNTDIVVSVRMVSEGVDVKRLRVGLYATNWLTRMFFIQFVGRFVRYEDRLDHFQSAVVVIPAHPKLLKWTLEIEKMILASQIKLTPGDGGGVDERKVELVGVETNADGSGLIYRGEEFERSARLIEEMRTKSAFLMRLSDSEVIKLANDLGIVGGGGNYGFEPPPINWRDRNNNLAGQIVRYMRANGESDKELFGRVNGAANAHVGIAKMDGLTPQDVLERRWMFLQGMLHDVLAKINPDLFAK